MGSKTHTSLAHLKIYIVPYIVPHLGYCIPCPALLLPWHLQDWVKLCVTGQFARPLLLSLRLLGLVPSVSDEPEISIQSISVQSPALYSS